MAAAAFLRRHLRQQDITILLLSFGHEIDIARRRSIECNSELRGVAVQFIERFTAYQFDEIYYASPVSYHPFLKLRGAIDYVRGIYMPQQPSADRKLYVTRPIGDVRSLVNAEEVEDFMRAAGFEVIDCAGMSFDQQLQLFSEASVVAGIMGAAMANTIFSQPSTCVLHLVCVGWLEPFYWDLADACGQRCFYVFGPSAEPNNPPHFARFTISIEHLAETMRLIA